MRYSLILLLIPICQFGFANCIQDSNNVALTYQVTKTQKHSEKHSEHKNHNDLMAKQTIVLWRHQDQVVIQYPDTQISELWEQTPQGKLRLVKNFEANQRGIEYQPSEIKFGEGENDWSLKYRLVSKKLLDNMQVIGTETNQCEEIKKLQQVDEGSSIKVDWMSEQKVFASMTIDHQSHQTEWQLEHVENDLDKISNYFTRLQNFQTTDYTDIGDNESDPFLIKMINLGFIDHSHGASQHQH